jgi:hypothetical protein
MKKLMFTFATLLVFAMGIVAFAYTTNGTTTTAAAACCSCCGDSCPMKNKDAKSQTTAAGDATTSGDHSCCKGDSCPMKKGDHSSHEGMMMKHDGDMKDMKDMKACPCCHHNTDKKDTAGI